MNSTKPKPRQIERKKAIKRIKAIESNQWLETRNHCNMHAGSNLALERLTTISFRHMDFEKFAFRSF